MYLKLIKPTPSSLMELVQMNALLITTTPMELVNLAQKTVLSVKMPTSAKNVKKTSLDSTVSVSTNAQTTLLMLKERAKNVLKMTA
jgi:hypothetical protein